MGILDKAKDRAKDAMGKAQELAGEARDKAHELAEEHAGQLKAGIDKTEALANKATKGKYAEKIEAIGEKAAAKVPTKETEEDPGPAPTATGEPVATDDPAPPADGT